MTFLMCYCSILLLAGTVVATPSCSRINDCACIATGINPAGIVNLYPLVNGTTTRPVFMANGTSPWVKDNYTFYYNPCFGFSMASTNPGDPCNGDLLCQHEWPFNESFNLGEVGSTRFAYVNNILIARYYSEAAFYLNNRTSEIMLLCDENEFHGKFVFVNESKKLFYQFNFTSMCACPGKCPNKTLVPDKWIQTDKCLYRQMRTGKVVNLQGLATPLKVATDKHTTYYYSPCDGLELGSLDEKCKDVSVCKQDMSTSPPTYIGIGSKEVEVTEDDGDIVLHYPATTDGGKCFDVKLICDQSVDDPILVYVGDNKMIMKAKKTCPL